ncbi:putative spore coat protein B [Bacillus clarus]|uniref:Putative spore coat protein B n=1 Tax=Bacillus clarus TaxID=2338372 RepID=A0A090YTE8_9BACI|nr:putative spore coat protein B [Bacillus clarus]
MNGLIGEYVRVNRGGPESQRGRVVAVHSDYFTLLNEKGEFHCYQLQHLKSITKNPKESSEDISLLPTLAEGNNFHRLLKNLKYRWVKINRGGPEKIEGILQDVSCGYVTLIVKEEIVQISEFHIKSVNYGLQVSEESDDSDENENTSSSQSYRARAQRQSSRGR